MIRGINRQFIFNDELDFMKMVGILRHITTSIDTKQKACEIYAYCLMGNHLHLLIKELGDDGFQILGIGSAAIVGRIGPGTGHGVFRDGIDPGSAGHVAQSAVDDAVGKQFLPVGKPDAALGLLFAAQIRMDVDADPENGQQRSGRRKRRQPNKSKNL